MLLASSPQQDSLLAQLLVDGYVEPGQDGEGDHDDEDEVEPHHIHLPVHEFISYLLPRFLTLDLRTLGASRAPPLV